MKRNWIAMLIVPVLALTLWGCPKEEPATPEPELEVVTEPAEEPTEVETPEPEPPQDVTEEELPSDIVELNAYVREQGFIGDVYFDFDKSDLRTEARERLAQNAEWLREHPELLVTIEGHCDERGTNEYNLALGQRRAESAKGYVVSLGIEDGRLRTISYGEERPVCTESDEACWQRNRRAHFVITGRR